MKFVVSLLLLLIIGFVSFAISQNYLDHLSKEKRAFYQDNLEKIEGLKKQVLNTDLADKERVAALLELQFKYPEVVLEIALELIDDPSLALANYGTDILSVELVKMNHSTNSSDSYHQLTMDRVNRATEALQQALFNSKPSVRNKAASTLASGSNDQALKNIVEAQQKQLFTESEAVNYLGLSDPSVSFPYLEKYFSNPEINKTAFTYAINTEESREKVILEYIKNPDKSPEVVDAAINVLAKTDTSFSNYGIELANNGLDSYSPETVVMVYQNIIKLAEEETHLLRTNEWNNLSNALTKDISRYETPLGSPSNTYIKLNELKRKLEKLKR